MKTSKANFIYLLPLLLFYTCTNLSAHDYFYLDEYKSGAYTEEVNALFTQVQEVAGFKTNSLLSSSKAIYTALQNGDVIAMNVQMSTAINWNGQTGFPFPPGDPHFNPNGLAEVLFNKVNQNWTNWEVYGLKFEETANNTVIVKGYYKTTKEGTAIEVPFIHVWTWKGNQVSKFQHFETSQVIAEQQ